MFYNFWSTLIIVFSSISLFKYMLYLFLAPLQTIHAKKLNLLGRKVDKTTLEKWFKVSIIVPAWNEEVGIITSIKSLLANNYNNLEIIVVDDGSKDGTSTLVQLFEHNYIKKNDLGGKTFKFIYKENGGKGSALNTGIKASTGNIIITMDADTRFEEDAIYNVVRYFADKNVDAAVGNVKVSAESNLIGIIQQMEYTMGFYFKRVHSLMNSEYIIGGAFGVFRRNLFDKYGYFDEFCKTEDIAMSLNLKRNGCRIVYAEDAIAYTEGASTIMGLFKQRLRWKKGRLDTFLNNTDMFFSLNKTHNKFLSFFIMPLALFTDVMLILEPIFLIVALITVFNQLQTIYLLGWILFVSIIMGITYLFGSEKNGLRSFLMIPLFYFFQFLLIFSEIYAIFGSIDLYLKKKDVVWQSWARKGVGNV